MRGSSLLFLTKQRTTIKLILSSLSSLLKWAFHKMPKVTNCSRFLWYCFLVWLDTYLERWDHEVKEAKKSASQGTRSSLLYFKEFTALCSGYLLEKAFQLIQHRLKSNAFTARDWLNHPRFDKGCSAALKETWLASFLSTAQWKQTAMGIQKKRG